VRYKNVKCIISSQGIQRGRNRKCEKSNNAIKPERGHFIVECSGNSTQ
jgi:hypothetical protein